MSISQNFPNTRPSLSINFARSQRLDPRITFARTTSGTRVGPDGYIEVIPADQPRFDFDPVTGESLGLLIEEQRVNRCTQSVNFNFSATSNTTETTIFNPDGTAAVRRVPLSSGNFHGASSNAADIDITGQSVGGTTDVTTSIFVRNYNNSNLRLLIGFVAFDATPTYRYFLTVIDTANPTTLGIPSGVGWSNGSTKVENYGNGWYRYTLSGRYNKVAGFNTISFVGEQIHSSTGQQFWNGDDVSGIYTWGKQIELGLFSTSYIPTAGSTVTRTVDNAKIDGTAFSSFYNPTEWTLMIGARRNYAGNFLGYPNLARINDGTNNNNIAFYGADASNQLTNNSITSGGVSYTTYVARSIPTTAPFKMIQALKKDSSTFGVDGVMTTTDTSVEMPVAPNQLIIGGDGKWGGTIQQLLYYPTALPSNQLVTLTK